jgi:hypothetical protein
MALSQFAGTTAGFGATYSAAAKTLTLDIGSTGKRVLWSGGGGNEAKQAAMSFAKSTGGQTLEMTPLGRGLDFITTPQTYPLLKPVWNWASKNFVSGAEGSVDVFQSASRGVRIDSTWTTIEYPQLMRQGNQINYFIIP